MNAKRPSLAVDCVVFDPGGRLLLIRRRNPPFLGQYALPGGYVEYGETTEHAAARELAEETRLVAANLSLIGAYSDPHRDPRGHMVSVASGLRSPQQAASRGVSTPMANVAPAVARLGQPNGHPETSSKLLILL